MASVKRTVRRAVVGAGAAAAGLALIGAQSRKRGFGTRSYAVLVNLDEDKLFPRGEHLAPPLERLTEVAEVRLQRPPNGRGTRVLATARRPGVDVRAQLREAKQLLETSEVLWAEPWPAARDAAAQRTTRWVDEALARGGWR